MPEPPGPPSLDKLDIIFAEGMSIYLDSREWLHHTVHQLWELWLGSS